MIINLDEYKPGEPITIIHNGVSKTYVEPSISTPYIDSKTDGFLGELIKSSALLKFELDIYGKDVVIN